MSSTSTVDIPTPVLSKLKDFRLNQQQSRSASDASLTNAIVLKVNKNELKIEIEDEFSGISLEDLQEELEENSPRYVILDYELKHNDGRVSYPLVLVYWCPATSSTQLSTLYTSALSNLSVQADIGKVVDMREGVLDRGDLERKLGK